VEISVDQSFTDGGITYLIEVDSNNYAKLLVGQYVLLNELCDLPKTHVQFLVVHFYDSRTKYNPQRTINNLDLVNNNLYRGRGIKYGAVHFDDLLTWAGGDAASFLSLLTG